MNETKHNSEQGIGSHPGMHDCSRRLKHILTIDVERITLQQIIDDLGTTGFSLLMILLCLPMLIPTPGLPGISQSFGTVLFLLSLQLIQGKKSISLPNYITKREFSKKRLTRSS